MNELFTITNLLLLALILLCICILISLFSLRSCLRAAEEDMDAMLQQAERTMADEVGRSVGTIRQDIALRLKQDADENRRNRTEVYDMLRQAAADQRTALERAAQNQQAALSQNAKEQQAALTQSSKEQQTALSQSSRELQAASEHAMELQRAALDRISEAQNQKLSALEMSQAERMDRYQEKLRDTLKTSLSELQEANHKKLSDIQAEIDRRLDTSLNERLDQSFRSVGEQLNRLYESLGELNKLESGVFSLNRTLSNVKTRGIFGETQLENILSNILSNSLYDRNVVTKKASGSRDPVEFAVKIPDKETPNEFMYLPIDSKFPATIYAKIQDASDAADTDALQKATKELEQFIKNEAKSIRDKYLDPPHTTDFGILFLPTESLYAEVLRIPGLSEHVQQNLHIVITGPTTIAALLNSLSIGFRYMAVNRDSQNILKLLSAIKAQYGKLSELIATANNRLTLAQRATSDLQKRTEIINRKLSSVEELDASDAKKLLGLNGIDT